MVKAAEDVYLDDGMRGFIVNTAKSQYWRVAGWYGDKSEGLADLIGDGYLCFYKCRDRYIDTRSDLVGSKDEKRWFQALVKTTFLNHINTLAAKHKGVSERPAADYVSVGEEGDSDIFEQNLPPQPELGSFMVMLAKAPTELAQLIKILATDSAEALGFQRKRSGRRLIRETTNEYYCRLVGVSPQERNLVHELQEYFG